MQTEPNYSTATTGGSPALVGMIVTVLTAAAVSLALAAGVALIFGGCLIAAIVAILPGAKNRVHRGYDTGVPQ